MRCSKRIHAYERRYELGWIINAIKFYHIRQLYSQESNTRLLVKLRERSIILHTCSIDVYNFGFKDYCDSFSNRMCN